VTLWIPFRSFRTSHLRHHDSELADPIDDPESFYTSGAAWSSAGPVRRAVLRANRTMVFRLVVWAALSPVTVAIGEVRAAWRNDPGARRAVGEHVVGAAAVAAVVTVSGIPWWLYLLGAVYGGRMLNLVRSFAEHRWVPGDAPRTAMVEAGPVMSLLMLNVNLHLAHHAEPWVPWFEIPAVATRIGAAEQAAAGAGRYRGGYLEVLRRYAFSPLDSPRYPGS
jgi:fatty acid desaturase